MKVQTLRDFERRFQMDPLQDCKGHVEVKAESSLLSQPEEHVLVKSEVGDVKFDYSLEQGMIILLFFV